jgi:hypothetical protein
MIRQFIPILFLVWAGMTAASPPANDHFASATIQTGPFWTAIGSLHGATSETNEPVLSGLPNGPTAWWRWTATSSGPFRVRTYGSERGNLLAVYRGSNMNNLRLVGYGLHSSLGSGGNNAEVAFSATAGTTYHIQVTGADLSNLFAINQAELPSRVRVSLAPFADGAFSPGNNAFTSASTISGSSAEILVCTANATSEASEPLPPLSNGQTVWVNWTAPSTGSFLASTGETDFNNIFAAYTGSSPGTLTRINWASFSTANSFPNPGGGRFAFQAVAGTVYRFQISGNSLATDPYGVCRLTIQPATPPPNDNFANAIALSGSMPSASGWATFATREAGEPGFDGDETGSLWWTWTAPATGVLTIVGIENSSITPYTGSTLATLAPLPTHPKSGVLVTYIPGGVLTHYQVTAGTVVRLRAWPNAERISFSLRIIQTLPNDDFANRITLTGATASHVTPLVPSSPEAGEPDPVAGLWYRWVAPSTGRFAFDSAGSPDFARVRVFSGTSLGSLVAQGTEFLVGGSPHFTGRVFFQATAGTEYAFRVQASTNTPGSYQVNVRPAPGPPNDNFASATVVSGGAWTVTGNNRDATAEAGEPFPFVQDSSPLASVWWKWTAPATGKFRLSTSGSSFNNILSIYTGATLTGLAQVAQNQNGGWTSSGSFVFDAVSGTTYTIRVDGQLSGEGDITLSLAPLTAPPNDNFSARLPLTGYGARAIGDVLGGTVESGEPSVGGANGGRSVWYDWTAPASGRLIFRITGERFSPAFGIYTGSAVNSLTSFISGGSGAPQSAPQTVTNGILVSAGTSYKIKVDGNPAADGTFLIDLRLEGGAMHDSFSSPAILSGPTARSLLDNERATAEAGEPAHAGSNAAHSVWLRWTAPQSGRVWLDSIGSAGSPRIAVYAGSAVNALTLVASDSITSGETFANLDFVATAGVTYRIAMDSSTAFRGLLVINLVSAAAAHAHDAFASALTVTADQFESLADFRGVTAEAGEPAHGGRPAARSLWWKWTPQNSRRALLWFESLQPGLTARVAVYRDGPLGSLEPIAALTTDSTVGRLRADVIAGQTYRVVIDSPAVASIPGVIRFGTAPANSTVEDAVLVASGASPLAADMTGAATASTDTTPTGRRERWWFWVPETNARMEWRVTGPERASHQAVVSGISDTGIFSVDGESIRVPGTTESVHVFDARADRVYLLRAISTTTDQLTVRLVESPRQVPPSNDLRYRATELAGTSWSLPITLGAESDNRLWWQWTAPNAGVSEISISGAFAEGDRLLAYANNASQFSAGASSTNGGPPVLRLSGEPGTRWTFAFETRLRRLRPAVISLAPGGTPPANDSFLSPDVLPASWTSRTGDITLASCQPGEPDHSNAGGTNSPSAFPPGRSVWYQWTPTVSRSGTLFLDSEADLTFRVYSGPPNSNWLINNPTALQPGRRTLALNFFAGQTYHIAVASRPLHETTGPFTLRFGGPANDLLTNAITIPAGGGSISVESGGAGIEVGEPGYGFSFAAARATMWWLWTAPASGSVWIDTLGSEFDTVLSIYRGNLPDLTRLAAENDNANNRPGVRASAVRFPVVSGQVYLIRVSRLDDGDPAGLARVNLSMTQPLGPYQRWAATYPSLTGPKAAAGADFDGDDLSNLLEMAFASNPLAGQQVPLLVPRHDGREFHVEAALDRDAMEALHGGVRIEAAWQVSDDLVVWRPGPPATITGYRGRLAVERISLGPQEGRFARVVVRLVP